MKKYETVVILDEKTIDDDGTKFLQGLENLIKEELKGTVVESTNLGRKQFAREIQKKKTGIYLDVIHEMDEVQVVVLRDKFKLNETVLRLQTYIYDRPE